MISSEEAYNKHLPEFSAIPEEKIKTPSMARDDVIGEAEELKVVALRKCLSRQVVRGSSSRHLMSV